MTNPTIAKRCTRCGAALRDKSRFCTQCGTRADGPPSSEPEDSDASNDVGSPESVDQQSSMPPAALGIPTVRELLHHEISLKERMEKFKNVSSKVIDDAYDDPGARFIVITVLLLILAFLLILLNQFIH